MHLVRLLLIPSGFRFSLTAIDRYSRWLVTVPLSEIAAEVAAQGFRRSLCHSFRCPQRFKQIRNAIWSTSLQDVGWHHRTPSNHDYKVVPSRKLHDREITSISDDSSIVSGPWILSRGCIAGFYRHLQRVVEGTTGIISRNGVWKPLHLPAVFLNQSFAYYANFTEFETRLRLHIGKLQPLSASRHATPRHAMPRHAVVIFKEPTKKKRNSWSPAKPACRPMQSLP